MKKALQRAYAEGPPKPTTKRHQQGMVSAALSQGTLQHTKDVERERLRN
jgi:hypothetical protein